MSRIAWHQIGTAAVALVVVAAVAGFAYTGLQGERGLGALAEARAEEARLEGELARLKAERREIQNLVTRLRPTSLDLDLLDERARAVLGHARPDEVIIRPVTR